MKKYFCIDLGGTKTIVALFNENGEQLFHVKFPTLSEKGVDFWFERLMSLSKVCIENNNIEMGCIASPGPLDIKSGKIVNIPTMGWKDVSIVKMLEDAFGFKFKLINEGTTMTSEEINNKMNSIVKVLNKKYGAYLREE